MTDSDGDTALVSETAALAISNGDDSTVPNVLRDTVERQDISNDVSNGHEIDPELNDDSVPLDEEDVNGIVDSEGRDTPNGSTVDATNTDEDIEDQDIEFEDDGTEYHNPVVDNTTVDSNAEDPNAEDENVIYLMVHGFPLDRPLDAYDVQQFFLQYGSRARVKVAMNYRRHSGRCEVVLYDPQSPLTFSNFVRSRSIPLNYYGVGISVTLDRAPSFKRVRNPEAYIAKKSSFFRGARIELGTLIAPVTFVPQWAIENASVGIDYDDRCAMNIMYSSGSHFLKLSILFKSIRGSIKLKTSETTRSITYILSITLSYPPSVFTRSAESKYYQNWVPVWKRISSPYVENTTIHSSIMKGLLPNRSDGVYIVEDFPPIGRWPDMCLTWTFDRDANAFENISSEEESFLGALQRLHDFGLIVNLARRVDLEIVDPKDLPELISVYDLYIHPIVKFKLLKLISYNLISEYHVTAKLVKLLKKYDPKITEVVLEGIIGNRDRIWDLYNRVKSSFSNTGSIVNKLTLFNERNRNQYLISKVIITPTKMYYDGPFVELGNRIIRTHRRRDRNFFRVTFCDDNFGPLSAIDKDLLLVRVNAIIRGILPAAGRKLVFLHYSNSSIRTNGCWFMEPFEHDGNQINPQYILSSVGSFSGIRNPALLGARMAQCFSSTTATNKIGGANLVEIPDVERNGFVFSDGVGKIGVTLARNSFISMCRYIVLHRTYKRTPSAYQFRLGGLKGVLTLDNNCDTNSLCYRPSQKKFDSKNPVFEICRTSFYSPAYLNHQIITILESLGVSKELFFSIFQERIKELDDMFVSSETAIGALRLISGENPAVYTLIRMIESGLFEAGDPYLTNMLSLFRVIQLKDIKLKCKILVKQSCSLLGVMDETGLLPPNTIFVQFTDPATNRPRILQRRVLISRFPCLHPGDVQVCDSINIPELRHLIDVVVFSQNGERPLPNMLSGGDLDGDTFIVYWDDRLFPPKTVKPMEYATTQKATFVANPSTDDVKTHFINFVKSNNLGVIANSWKAISDMYSVFHPHALRLAELHSDAVDFAKKGKPVQMSRELRPVRYPDFMGKPANMSYKSEKAIGDIYRSVVLELKLNKAFKPLRQLIIPGFEKHYYDALATKRAYDSEIKSLMNQYGIRSEFEVCSGFIWQANEVSIKKNIQDLKDHIVSVVYNIREHYRGIFFNEIANYVAEHGAEQYLTKVQNGTLDSDPAFPAEDVSLETLKKEYKLKFTRTYRADMDVRLDMALPEIMEEKASAWYLTAYTYDTDVTKNLEEKDNNEGSDDDESEIEVVYANSEPEKAEEEDATRKRNALLDEDDREYQNIDFDMGGHFVSFPWVIHDVISNIFKNRTI